METLTRDRIESDLLLHEQSLRELVRMIAMHDGAIAALRSLLEPRPDNTSAPNDKPKEQA